MAAKQSSIQENRYCGTNLRLTWQWHRHCREKFIMPFDGNAFALNIKQYLLRKCLARYTQYEYTRRAYTVGSHAVIPSVSQPVSQSLIWPPLIHKESPQTNFVSLLVQLEKQPMCVCVWGEWTRFICTIENNIALLNLANGWTVEYSSHFFSFDTLSRKRCS